MILKIKRKKKQKKEYVLENLYTLFKGKVLNAFDTKMFPIKTDGKGF